MPCDFFLKIREDKFNYYIAIDVNERARARYLQCPGRTWNRLTKEWGYPRTPMAYRAICDEFGEYPEKLVRITPPDAGSAGVGAGGRALQNTVIPASVAIHAPVARAAPAPVAPAAPAAQIAAQSAAPAPESNQPKQPPPVPTDAAGTALKFPAPAVRLEEVVELLNSQARAVQRLHEQLASLETAFAKLPAPPRPAPGVDEIAGALRPLLASLEEKLERKNIPLRDDGDAMRQMSEWLSRMIIEGAGDNPVITDICSRWNLVRDFHPVVTDLEEQLCWRLRELLNDDGSGNKNLHRLCDDAFMARVIDKECTGLLTAFRRQRYKITSKAREGWSRQMLRYLHALTAFAIVWPLLDEIDTAAAPSHSLFTDDGENEDADPA